MVVKKLPLYLGYRFEIIQTIKTTTDSKIDLCYDFLSRDKVIMAHFKKKYFHVSIQRLKELKKLRHLNLVKVRSISHTDSMIIIVMDYVYGKQLSEILLECRESEMENLKKWCGEIKEAITFLHDIKPIGFLHGDIKAENIIIDSRNKAVLIDFSCFKEDLKQAHKDIRATVAYAAENVLNLGIYDTDSDWHSFKMLEDRCLKKT